MSLAWLSNGKLSLWICRLRNKKKFFKGNKVTFSTTAEKTYLEIENHMTNQDSVSPVLQPTLELDWIKAKVAE